MEQNETIDTSNSPESAGGASTTTPTKMELLQAKRKAARAEKEAAKAARKVELAQKRAGGVIGTIRAALELPTGTTRREVLETLTKKFPDRDRDGMAVTVGIQFSRLAKSTGRKIVSVKELPGRTGRVYGFADSLVLPAVEAVNTPEAAPTPAPVAELHTEEAHKPASKPIATGKRAKQKHNR